MKNNKVVLSSLAAFAFLIMAFSIDWIFIIISLALLFFGQRELMKKK